MNNTTHFIIVIYESTFIKVREHSWVALESMGDATCFESADEAIKFVNRSGLTRAHPNYRIVKITMETIFP